MLLSPVNLNLPVGLSRYIDIVKVSSVVLWIGPAQHQLPPYCRTGVPAATERTENMILAKLCFSVN